MIKLHKSNTILAIMRSPEREWMSSRQGSTSTEASGDGTLDKLE